MAWVQQSSSGKYIAKYRDGHGKVRTAPGGPFTHKRAAVRAGEAAEAASRALGWRSPDAAARTWGDWCEEWWKARTVETSTMKSDLGRRDNHLMPRWGATPLIDITRQDVKAWAAELRTYTRADGTTGTRAAATVERITALFSVSLAAAVDAEILEANPAARLKVGGGEASVERYLTHDEFDAILEHLDGEYRRMVTLLAGTGLRWSEAAGLHWSRVEDGERRLEVAEVWSLTGRTMKPYPKGKRRRYVPVPEWVELGERPERAGTCGYPHTGPACRSSLVLTTESGTIVDQSKFSKVWARAVKAADVGHVRPHDLRHTYASWLLQDGVPLARVGKLLGHVSPVTTQRYAHLDETPADDVLAALDRRKPRRATDRDVQPAGRRPSHLRVVR